VPFRNIQDPAKLRRLLEAVLLLEADLSLPTLLRHFVEEACATAGARYGALGVLNDDRTGLSEFVTVGIDEETQAEIGARPTGRGVLGLLITEPKPVRLSNLSEHEESFGFPPGHPPMTSFLGVPVATHAEVYGNLYLTDKIGWSEFTADDEELVVALAQAAGIAIENARLHQRVQEIAVLEDRDRIARDLHDAIIQRLFAVGLSLQGLVRHPTPPAVAERISRAISDIDQAIIQIRSSIFELADSTSQRGLRSDVLEIVRDLSATLDFDVPVSFEGPVDTALDPDLSEHILATVREGLTNIARHAAASSARVHLGVDDEWCVLEIIDNGQGIAAATPKSSDGGLGLGNLRRRAQKHGGDLAITSPPGGGTILTWRVRRTG
jgi:two-component system, NarL family, sensor histidine kinase DevS